MCMGYSATYIRVILYINQSSCTNCLHTQVTPPMAVSCHWHKTGLLATAASYLIHTLRTPGSSLSAPHLSREARMFNVSPTPTPLPLSCLEFEGCHLIPLSYTVLLLFSCLVLLLFLSCHYLFFFLF